MANDTSPDRLRTGFTTGACAAAAAKAAMMLLSGSGAVDDVEVTLPGGDKARLAILRSEVSEDSAWASVRKDAGDDPDVTDGVEVRATVKWASSAEVSLRAGQGVGTVTKPGLAIPPGEPAINPVPRQMIRDSVREISDKGVEVTVSIPGGEELAKHTFNPRLGVVGGLSILGTSGIVRPFSSSALRDSLVCSIRVARACGVKNPVFVPGRIGERAAKRMFALKEEQLVEVSNEWGFMLDRSLDADFERLLVLGHPGKLAKLAQDQWDTHSSRSESAAPMVADMARRLLGKTVSEEPTVEGVFSQLAAEDSRELADHLAKDILVAVSDRVRGSYEVSVLLVNLRGEKLGSSGDLTAWERLSQ